METTADATAADAAVEATIDNTNALVEGDLLVEEELLVEEISIDGMCGVY